MGKSIEVEGGRSSAELRRLAARTKDANQSRRLLSIAAIQDGMSRKDAARIGGMDRQTLRDWVHRYNEQGSEGLKDRWRREAPRRLTGEQLAELAQIVETGPDREKDGVVRWRRVDLKRVVADRFGVDYHERTIGKLLDHLGFSHISARPKHPKQDAAVVEAFKKTSRARSRPISPMSPSASE
jgi:transposase